MSEESRRKQVTLVCFILANIIFASLLIYLDSYSTYTWDYETNVGPATMFMQSEEVLPSMDDLESVPGIERVAKMEKSWCSLVAFPPDQNATTTAEKGFTLAQGGGAHDPNINLTVAAIENNQDLFTDFPSIFNITEGRWPTRNIECALAQWLIDFYGVELGAIVTFESGFVHEYHFFRVVGIFDHPEDDNRNYAYYNLGDIVVMPEFVSQRERMHYAYLKVNDYFLSPLQPAAALSYLSDIEEDVRYLDPQYELFHHTTFSLDDIQSRGIQRYIEKAALTKTSQLIRSQIAIFIGVILSVSTVRYNSQKQEKRAELLLARGASSRQIILVKIREILSLSLLAAAASVGVGILISRVGLLSEGFFVLRTISISEMPVLVTLESLAVIIVYAVIIPLVAFAGISISSREKDTEHIELGKLARFVGALRFFRWDALVVLISFGFLFGLWEVGNQILRTPLFSAIIYTIPVFLMIGLASLLSKAAQTSSFYISKGLSKFLPRIGAEVGGRRIGRDRKVSGFTILVFALVTSLMWSNIIVNATLPNTALGHARFALSGDVAFNLDADFYDMFDDVRENLSLVPGVVSTTMVNVYSYSLSSSLLDTVDFAVIDTDDIDSVAYDETGIPLENSYLSEIVTLLDENPAGAIITSDLADTYELDEGDLLRAFRSNGTEVISITFNLLKVVTCLPDTMVTGRGYDPPQVGAGEFLVGKGRVWVSNDYEQGLIKDAFANGVFLCARISDQVSGGAVIDSLFACNPGDVIFGYASASEYAARILTESEYVFESAIDTMVLFCVIIALPSVYLSYVYSGKESRRRDDSILQILGASPIDLKAAHQIEIHVLTLHGVFLLLLSMPLFLQNSFVILMLASSTAYSAYPIPILTVVPVLPIAIYLIGLCVLTGLIVYVVGAAENRDTLSKSVAEINEERNNFERRS